jgi:hypothetical protein
MISGFCHSANEIFAVVDVTQHRSAVTDVSVQLSVPTSMVKQSKLGRLI